MTQYTKTYLYENGSGEWNSQAHDYCIEQTNLELKNVNVDDVLIRPLGHAFSAQLHVVLDQNLTLKEAHGILTKINASVSEKFGTEETTVIPRPG